MKLNYTPEGLPAQTFDFSPENMLSTEAEAIEEVGGTTWGSYLEFGAKLSTGNVRAMRALLWVLLCRTNPTLDFDSVVFRLDEFTIEDDDDEPEGKDEAGDDGTVSPSATTA